MRRIVLLLSVLLAGAEGQAQQANPLTGGARFHYGIIKGYVTRAAAKMPEGDYSFRPAAGVRTFAQLIGHLADSNFRLCSVLAGDDPPIDAGIERDKHAKAELMKALEESFAYCDKQYAAMKVFHPPGAANANGTRPARGTRSRAAERTGSGRPGHPSRGGCGRPG